MRYLFLITCTLIVFTSCKTSFRISVQEPAAVKIPDTALLFGVVNNVNDENSPDKILRVALGTEKLNGNTSAAERAVDGVLRALENSGNLRGVVLVSDSIDFGGGPRWDFIDSISATNNLQGIIQLVEVSSNLPVGGAFGPNLTRNSSVKLNGKLIVNIFIANTHETFELLSVKDSYNIPVNEGSSILNVLGNNKRKKEFYRLLGFELGYKAGSLIYPNFIWVDRDYYNKGSKSLKKTKMMIYRGDWDIAEQQLLQDVNHFNDKTRGRILYNLALVKEGQGEINAAINYAEQSVVDCGNKSANAYLSILRERKFLMDEINE